ncbi:MAG: hypothetical protein WCW47_01195 [Candidatus Paceibacterota bacterium]|jgi:hypothetical protein
MAQTMTASPMTDGQIDTVVDQLRAAMRKHQAETPKDGAQQALGVDNLGMRMFAVFRELVESLANLIIRLVDVDNTRTPEATLKATGRKQYVDAGVVATMPKGTGGPTEVVFFKPRPEAYKNGVISDDDLEKEYEFAGLKPADPYSVAAVNEADPTFADTHLHGTHWKDENGKWCFATFRRWHGGRRVHVKPPRLRLGRLLVVRWRPQVSSKGWGLGSP